MDKNLTDKNNNKKKAEEEKQKKINKRTLTYGYDINNWILLFREKMSKKSYKKVLKDITGLNLLDQFKSDELGYKITIFYIQAKLKIIENKIFKYHLILNEKLKHQISRCFHYAKNIPQELDTLLNSMPSNLISDPIYYDDIKKRNFRIQYVDDIIRCYFDYIYVMGLLYFKLNDCVKSICYLNLGLQLFSITKYYLLSPHSLFKAQKCFILLAKIYITNEDYKNALLILYEAIKICFKQILFQIQDIYMGFFIGEKEDIKVRDKSDLDKLKDSRMKRTILNIIIIFLYLGICYENMSNIKKATAFYKQCEWFTRIFLLKDNNGIYKFFFRLKKKSIEVCNVVDFLQEKIHEVDKRIRRKMEEALKKNLKKKRGRESLFYDIKFKKLINKLDKLKIKEIDTINKFERNEMLRSMSSNNKKIKDKYFFMTNLRLLEAYLTKEFRHLVLNMDQIKLFDLDSITRGRVQKLVDELKYEEEQKRRKNKGLSISPTLDTKKNTYTKSLSNKNSKIENEKSDKNSNKIYSKLNIQKTDNKKNLMMNSLNNNTNYLRNKFRIQFPKNENKNSLYALNKERNIFSQSNNDLLSMSTPNKKNISFNFKTPTNKSCIETTKIFPKKIKINLKQNSKGKRDHYFLNLRYLRKRNYIKKLSDREINFQKNIIRTKRSPIPEIHYFNRGLSFIEADNSFGKIKTLVSNVNIYSDWKDNMTEQEYKDYLIRTRLENSFLFSLNSKALEKYKALTNRKDMEDLEDYKYEKSLREVDKVNKSTLSDLTLKLNAIYENEQIRKRENMLKNMKINKQLIKRLYRNRSSTGRIIRKKENNTSKRKVKFSLSFSN